MKERVLILLFAMVLVLSACGESSSQPIQNDHEAAHGEQQHLPNGDLQEVTASVDILPSFLDGKSEQLQVVYQIAGKAADTLDWMPCYCGCGESAGHMNNKNCFINEIREDGAVVWDDHGTRCNVCVDTAIESVKMLQDGKSLNEIREVIDETYKEGYSVPTDTPKPL